MVGKVATTGPRILLAKFSKLRAQTVVVSVTLTGTPSATMVRLETLTN